MALWARVMVNSQSIGLIEAQCVSTNRPQPPVVDAEYEYDFKVQVNGTVVSGTLTHRYGDGALALMRKVLDRAEGLV